MLNRWVLSWDQKTAMEGAEVTRSGRLFQTREAATGKARSPTVRSRVRLTINDKDELERSIGFCFQVLGLISARPWKVQGHRNKHPVRSHVLFINLLKVDGPWHFCTMLHTILTSECIMHDTSYVLVATSPCHRHWALRSWLLSWRLGKDFIYHYHHHTIHSFRFL